MSSRKRKTKPARVTVGNAPYNELYDANGGIQLPVEDDDIFIGSRGAETKQMTSRKHFADDEEENGNCFPTDLRAARNGSGYSDHSSRTPASPPSDNDVTAAGKSRKRSVIGDDVMDSIQSALSSAETIEDKQSRLNAMIQQLETIRANLECNHGQPHHHHRHHHHHHQYQQQQYQAGNTNEVCIVVGYDYNLEEIANDLISVCRPNKQP